MRIRVLALLVMWCLVSFFQAQAQQSSSDDQKQASSQNAAQTGELSGAQSGDSDEQPGAQPNDNKPGPIQRLKRHLRDQMSSGCVNGVGEHCWDKPAKDDSNKDPNSNETSGDAQKQSSTLAAPRSDDNQTPGESSSNSTKIDLSPPAGEPAAPGVGGTGSDVQEMKPWDPHKADKDVEVGDFYFKQRNYVAAESRYAEALYWQDNHAIANFRLAEAQEKLGKFAEARTHYQAYLKILPHGEFVKQCNEGLTRLKGKPDQPVRTSVTVPEIK